MAGVRKLAARTALAAGLMMNLAVAGLMMNLAVAGAAAQELPLPRWVSLRSDEVNVRVGPGTDYPIQWVFVREGLPVEITAESDNWRRIRDIDGDEGWVHRSLLSGARTVVVTGGIRTMWRTPDAYAAAPVLRAEAGVIGRLLECAGVWCRLEINGERGWMPRVQMWGVYPDEAVE